jgi:SAM-dependent methyltransferase
VSASARAAASADVATGFTYASTELDAMAGAVNYHDAILERFLPYVPHRAGRQPGAHVVEIGAGIGTIAARLLALAERERRPIARLTLVEPAENNVPLLASRFRPDPRVRIHAGYFDAARASAVVAEGGADAIVMVNVLEHVADDGALLADIHRALRPGGRLCLFVPALPWLYGSLDEAFEHHRRYTTGAVRALLARARLRPLALHYMNAAGVIPWLVAGRLLRRRTLDPSLVALYDRVVAPWMNRLERRWRPPLGQSVLAVAER